ncbi:Attractin-like protein 1 [Chionoecetes opilio]|uniref:Attractin-like protein 1 n=1 Tax=Chionoecetes opilio TaxID=41210 RepID=A0A8J4Y405_CHIOP|nr:Attractin-like protein 1 [Chionoecetes opilio]
MSNSSVITDGSGNYSTDTQCTWLIDSGQVNTSIRLHLDHFATECSWDHLYVFDGDSIYDPLLAVFRINGCPRTIVGEECSGHGVCLDGFCTCNAGWGGPACSVRVCPEGCSGNGQCHPEEHRCQCHPGYTGADCSQVVEAGWWEVVGHDITSQLTHSNPASTLLERSSHTTVLIDDTIWVIGGHSFTERPFILKYEIQGDKWITVESTSIKKPMHRYGHTTVVYNVSCFFLVAYPYLKNEQNCHVETDVITTRSVIHKH